MTVFPKAVWSSPQAWPLGSYSLQDPWNHFSTKLVSSQVKNHSHVHTLFICCPQGPRFSDLWGTENTLQNFNMAQAA